VKEQIPSSPKELSEAKGSATAAYQQFLEATWLEELAKKYPINVNTEVLYSLGKE
jgi:peptidyl-prolyl cis-trans isomerase SurA